MLNPWFAASLLAMEAVDVIHLRMWKVAGGGRSALDEIQLMFGEKVVATWEAMGSVMMGTRRFQSMSAIASSWQRTR